MILPLLLLSWVAAAPECHSSGQTVACGYHCKVGLDQAVCAQTPEGFCTDVEGHLVCWDPPEAVRFHRAAATPVCKSLRSKIACGYQCAASDTEIACTQTPFGRCIVDHGRVTCWEPAEQVVHAFAGRVKTAECLTHGSTVACGYSCKDGVSGPLCAGTPAGICTVDSGKVHCWDPPLELTCHHQKRAQAD